MSLLAQGVTFFKNIFTNKAAKAFKDDFVTATIQWIEPIFLEEDKKIIPLLEEGNLEKANSRLTNTLEDLLDDSAFKTKLEAILKESANHQVEYNIDHSVGRNATVTGGSIVGGNQSNSHNTNSNNNNSNNSNSYNTSNSNNTTTINNYSTPQLKNLIPKEEKEDTSLAATFANVKQLVGENKITNAIKLLNKIANQPKYIKYYSSQVNTTSGRWNRLKTAIRTGAITYDQASSKIVNLNNAIISIADEMENDELL